ncbi:hypothetical protein QOM21_33955 [Streptomyces sp. Pv4-95]|uniref:hypothetical protein n=1 Tax=Streptomyces sp. Pv4-95 TaxID=3049543 RepID=UPI00389200C4
MGNEEHREQQGVDPEAAERERDQADEAQRKAAQEAAPPIDPPRHEPMAEKAGQGTGPSAHDVSRKDDSPE